VTNKYLTVEFTIDATPEAAYEAINNPRGWWSADITGGTTAVGDEFIYGDTTDVRLTHVGLTPESECIDACTKSWEHYAGEQLPALIAAQAVSA
jgi:hypothetical protein